MHVGKVGIILDQTISPNIAIKEVADSGQKRGAGGGSVLMGAKTFTLGDWFSGSTLSGWAKGYDTWHKNVMFGLIFLSPVLINTK